MRTFADQINEFNKHLGFIGTLPNGISIMNPFKESKYIMELSSKFYKKYYNDNYSRHLILRINPGRFGLVITGIPFTDPKRLIEKCNIIYTCKKLTHEPSSVFVYDVIDAFGGLQDFYQHFYINSVCPLGFTTSSKTGKEIHYNYYDSKELTIALLSIFPALSKGNNSCRLKLHSAKINSL